ncbi:MAG: glutamate racemase [Candidatus Izemoplasmatales bacterium]|nr:glutamate racemase [Candidatus Izemoplasmatales bacterium]MDD5293099.1 glutamate racemase [Candidatus Izemoplasmatales bacterium]
MDNRPIGVFDSGLGGLSILKTLTRAFPYEDFIYVADLKNCPYGVKTKAQIAEYVSDISDYLVKRDVKAIVIACNTATANSQHLHLSIPVIGMIQATAKEAMQYRNRGSSLVLATDATVQSHLYRKALNAYQIEAIEVACPTFVMLVEEGKMETSESYRIVSEHLKPYQELAIDSVILGCTHFGFLKQEIHNCLPDAVLVGGGVEVSRQLRHELEHQDAFASDLRHGVVSLVTTGDRDEFKEKIQLMNMPYDEIRAI